MQAISHSYKMFLKKKNIQVLVKQVGQFLKKLPQKIQLHFAVITMCSNVFSLSNTSKRNPNVLMVGQDHIWRTHVFPAPPTNQLQKEQDNLHRGRSQKWYCYVTRCLKCTDSLPLTEQVQGRENVQMMSTNIWHYKRVVLENQRNTTEQRRKGSNLEKAP